MINFDVNHTTNLAGVSPDLVQRVIQGLQPLDHTFPGGTTGLAAGVNGLMRVGYSGMSSPGVVLRSPTTTLL